MNKIIIALLLSSIHHAFAGGTGAGNGGDVLVCKNSTGKITRVQFFDLYESSVVYGRTPNLGETALSTHEKIKFVADRNKVIFPKLMDELLAHSESFLDRTTFTPDELIDIPDSGDVLLPNGCKIHQLIIRTKNHFEINSTYWNLMDTDSKAAAISHEFFYGRAVDQFDHSNSFNARVLNSYFLYSRSADLNHLDWYRVFQELTLGFIEPWGSYSPKPYSSSIYAFNYDYYDQPEKYFVIRSRATAPIKIKTKNLGTVILNTGDYELHYYKNVKDAVLYSGQLKSEVTLTHPMITIKGSGEYWYGNDTNGFRLSGEKIQVLSMKTPGMTIHLSPDCARATKYLSTSSNPGSWFNLTYASPCNAEVQYHEQEFKLKTTSASSITIGSAYDSELTPNVSIAATVKNAGSFVDINWPYGIFRLENNSFIFTFREDSVKASSNDYKSTIGYFPKLGIGRSTLEKVPFSSVDIASIKNHRLNSLGFSNEEVDFALQPSFTVTPQAGSLLRTNSKEPGVWEQLNFPIYLEHVPFWNFENGTKIKIKKLDGFSDDYIRSLRNLTINENEYELKYLDYFSPKDHTPAWIPKITFEELFGDHDVKTTTFEETFPKEESDKKYSEYSYTPIWLKFNTPGILYSYCNTLQIPRYYRSASYAYTLHFAKEAAEKWGSSRFVQEPIPHPNWLMGPDLELVFCFTKNGYELTDLRKKERN